MIRSLLIFMCATAFADTLSAQKVTVKGDLIDKNLNLKVDYATIAVYRTADSTFTAGVLSDSLGCFSIELSKGKYFLEVSHINYQKHTQPLGISRKDTTLSTINMVQQAR